MLPTETYAEQMALEAVQLDAFPLQLHEIRRTVYSILDQFGRGNIFSQYTVHNYSHVHSMLNDLDRFLTPHTKTSLTKTDWLILTLGIYFHDIGLVVTEEEYTARSTSGFEKFKQEILFNGRNGDDYRQKTMLLGPDLAERFYYQEFVRHNHAKRVASWIEGASAPDLGHASTIIAEINRLFGSTSKDFRRDIARICESHNLDDLDDTSKYKTFKPYGPSNEEVGNLLFCAVMIRTLDLLQITRQRAPSIMFRLINPTDPISQIEWIKQSCVTGVFVKDIKDSDGHVIADAQSDTVSVFAKYDNENGFFGLTSYLQYAQSQILASHAAIKKAHPGTNEKYQFPWKVIDDSDVEADGFDPRPYQFRLDQSKILDLLTGHTLYNDSSIAIRELVQNSLDAVRLVCQSSGKSSEKFGKVSISWDENSQILSILDNGTGMTQEVIEKHLLSVGSSRYQEPIFQEKNPTFHSISRFGIGVLSAFMVADTIQIVTFSAEGEEGRQISLRSVHGKYLIRLLPRDSDAAKEIGEHGTKITIKIRASSKRVNVRNTLERWIVFPRCAVILNETGLDPITIGFLSPKEAIEKTIALDTDFQNSLLTIEERSFDGVHLAVALKYSKHFREKSLYSFSPERFQKYQIVAPVGLCVEGVRVEFKSPGIEDGQILGIVNCVGANAPKTNVSRNALEDPQSKSDLSDKIFQLYLDIASKEIGRLQSVEGFSLTYATNQFPYIAAALYPRAMTNQKKYELFSGFPLAIVEEDTGRSARSIIDIESMQEFWTVESNAIDSMTDLLQDARSDVTARQVAERCGFSGEPMPSGAMLTNIRNNWLVKNLVDYRFKIVEIRASILDRRLDVRWAFDESEKTNVDRVGGREFSQIFQQLNDRRRMRPRESGTINAAFTTDDDIEAVGLENFIAASVLGSYHLVPGTAIAEFFRKLPTVSEEDDIKLLLYMDALAPAFIARTAGNESLYIDIDYQMRELVARYGDRYKLDTAEFLSAVKSCEHRLASFQPYGWTRNDATHYDM